jgi:predicted O-linked N-acetylglucosamine transferase (SPINDLY family)
MPDPVQAAQAHIAAGRLERARAVLAQAVARQPGAPAAVSLLAWTLMNQGRQDQARFYAERAVALRPGDPGPLSDLGKLLSSIGQPAPAVEAWRKAVALAPNDAALVSGLVAAFNSGRRFIEAEATARDGLERWPRDPELVVGLALALHQTGRARQAVPILERAAAAHPDNASIAMLHANALNYVGDADPREAIKAHEAFGAIVERQLPGPHAPPALEPSPERPLRIGLISGDLRSHAVGHFIRPLFEHHDRRVLSLFCYSTSLVEDSVSRRLASLAGGGWRAVPHLTIGRLAEQIRRDRIDILIELSGLTGGHRLEVFQLRPAAIGVSYLGYPATTGMRAIDYRIVDRHTDPPEPWYDSLCTEKLWRLDPCFNCYTPPPPTGTAPPPEPAPPPSQRGAPFTFGSFNNLAKHDEAALDLYRRVLEAVPGSRFRLSYWNLTDPDLRALTVRRFADAGMDPARLVFPDAAAPDSLLPAYAGMDVMLDSYPYQGTTTTCEALYMGVPVVALEGRVSASRVATSILTNMGLPELIACSPEQYAQIAADLASDPARLATLHATLRSRLLASPLCDGPGFARRFEAALRAMWREWCARPRAASR